MASLSAAIRSNRTLVVGGVTLFYVDTNKCPRGTMECYVLPLGACTVEDAAPTNVPCSAQVSLPTSRVSTAEDISCCSLVVGW